VGPGYDAVPAGERWGAPLQLRGGGEEQQGGRTKELRSCPAAPPPPGYSRSQVSVANSWQNFPAGSVFPSPAEMSNTKLSLAGNKQNIPGK